MFEPDEYLFTKAAFFFKNRRKRKAAALAHVVYLSSLKERLTIFARAITGASIDLYPAEREGGYKNTSFFLPTQFGAFKDATANENFYLFRVLYLSVQKNLKLNWKEGKAHSLEASQEAARKSAPAILAILFQEFPNTKELHQQIHAQLTQNPKKSDLSFLYGKWMHSEVEKTEDTAYDESIAAVKSTENNLEKTLLKAQAVEELCAVTIDKKQLEDAVLQHQFEKVETAEEFGGNFRDFDGEDELEDHANALEDVQMKYTVRVDDTAHSVYQADFMENTTILESAGTDEKGYFIPYDEWDHAKKKYQAHFCKVYPKTLLKTAPNYYQKTIQEYQGVLMSLRKSLSSFSNKYQQQRRQTQGDSFDLDALTDVFVAVQSQQTPSEKIYFSKRKKEKDMSILILLDSSLSSDGYAAGNKVIDVEKQVSILFGEVLEELGIDFSIQSFSSKTRNNTTYITVKDFDENWQQVKHKIGAIEPTGYTRIGAALRHSGALLAKREARHKWVLLLSDGKPNDYDRYEGTYGVQDVKQALRELDKKHIHAYALAVEAQAKYYLPQMFGTNNYQILTSPVALLHSMVHLYEKIKHTS